METPEIAKERLDEPVGICVLGDKDPSNLSLSEFIAAKDLVYHGSAKPFTFRDDLDYGDETHTQTQDGSRTLGSALYAIPDQQLAAHYSIVRNARNEGKPHVSSILPFKARVLDLRSRRNLDKNGSFPKELISKWLIMVKIRAKEVALKEITRTQVQGVFNNVETFEPLDTDTELWADYVAGLERLINKPCDFTLRQVLGTSPCPEMVNDRWLSPPWCNLWQQFMIAQQIDGVIYIEGGEKGAKDGTSYAFYNLASIGTYEKWQERKQQ